LRTVLAVFAHPDDAELTCFGTLGVLKSRGYRVLVGIVTDGIAGLPYTAAGDRVREAERASAIMGFELLRGGLPDGDLQYSSRLIMAIEHWVSESKPAIIITHDYDPAGAVLNIVHRRPEIELSLQVEPSRGSRSFEPNAFVDVSQFTPEKLAAIACHESQSHKDYLQPAYLNLRSHWWATVSGLTSSDAGSDFHVEAFRIAKCSIFAASALAFAGYAGPVTAPTSADAMRSGYAPLRRVV
jgi:LmbE family N-acetylglucosaminyl deacetylase